MSAGTYRVSRQSVVTAVMQLANECSVPQQSESLYVMR